MHGFWPIQFNVNYLFLSLSLFYIYIYPWFGSRSPRSPANLSNPELPAVDKSGSIKSNSLIYTRLCQKPKSVPLGLPGLHLYCMFQSIILIMANVWWCRKCPKPFKWCEVTSRPIIDWQGMKTLTNTALMCHTTACRSQFKHNKSSCLTHPYPITQASNSWGHQRLRPRQNGDTRRKHVYFRSLTRRHGLQTQRRSEHIQ